MGIPFGKPSGEDKAKQEPVNESTSQNAGEGQRTDSVTDQSGNDQSGEHESLGDVTEQTGNNSNAEIAKPQPTPVGDDLARLDTERKTGEVINTEEPGREKAAAELAADESGLTGEALVEANLANHADDVEEANVLYSSNRIPNYRLGRYQFTKGVLKLTPSEAAKFDALLAKSGPRAKATVTKIDVDAANRVSAQFKESTRVRGVDTAGLGVNAG